MSCEDPVGLMAQMMMRQERKRGRASGGAHLGHQASLLFSGFDSSVAFPGLLPSDPGRPCGELALQLAAVTMMPPARFLDVAAARLVRQRAQQQQTQTAALPDFSTTYAGNYLEEDWDAAALSCFLEQQSPASSDWGLPRSDPSPPSLPRKQPGNSFAAAGPMSVLSTLAVSPSELETSEIVSLLHRLNDSVSSLSYGMETPTSAPAAKAVFPSLSSVDSGVDDSSTMPSFWTAQMQPQAQVSRMASPSSAQALTPEQKKERRLAGNREAARRLRKRHSDSIREMEGEIKRMRGMHEETVKSLAEAQAKIAKLTQENERLVHEMSFLQAAAVTPPLVIPESVVDFEEAIFFGQDC